MKLLTRAFLAIGVALCLLALSGGTRQVQAQRFTCWQCVLNQNTHTYSCQYGGGQGNTSCTYISPEQGCYLGSRCGYYLALADGSFEQVLSRPTVAKTSRRTNGGQYELLGVSAARRRVQRGCNGSIIMRAYDVAVAQDLRSRTSVIRI